MAEIEESLLKIKIDSYSSKMNDFQAENELTVEITLSEYRDLIENYSVAKYKIDEANKNKYTRDEENRKLRQENKEIEIKLFEYRKKFGELDVKTEEQEES